jgi:hypothetical protein
MKVRIEHIVIGILCLALGWSWTAAQQPRAAAAQVGRYQCFVFMRTGDLGRMDTATGAIDSLGHNGQRYAWQSFAGPD